MTEKTFEEIKKAMENTRLSFDILGAVAFGSRVKGKATPYSDFDLLIIAKGINPKRHRRGEEIIQLKRCLPLIPFDILLFSPEEVISNFKNHNPLFLDITEEGVIILDGEDFLRNLILETKEYIRQRGIKRFGDGWIFPAKKGVPTYLSRVSNKDFSYAMLKDGERDFKIGEGLIKDGFYDKAVYHFQQSVEKAIKSVLIAMGVFQKTHFIGEILQKIVSERDISEKWKTDLIGIASISEEMEPEVSLSRYPGIIDDSLWLPFDEYEKKDADRAMEKATKVLHVARRFIDDWFSKIP